MKDIKHQIRKGLVLALAVTLQLLVVAAPALSTLIAPLNSVATKSIIKGAVTSAKIKNKTIKNIDIAAGAAIAATKINRVGLDADLLDGKHASDFVQKTGDQSMAGTLTAANYAFGAPKTRTLTISAPDFSRGGDPGNNYAGVTDGYIYSMAGVNFQASVNLPQGATVKSIRYWLYNNVGGEVWGQMWRTNRAPAGFTWTEMSRAELTANSTDWAVLDDATIASPVIDNVNNTYEIQAKIFTSDPDVRFAAAIITYEVQEP